MRNKLVPIGSVVQLNPESIGKAYPYKEIEYIDISSVGTGTLGEISKLKLSEAPSRAKRIVRDGDTILATVRPNLRSFLYIKQPSPNTVASTGFAVLRATEAIDRRFLYYAVTNQAFTDYLSANVKGAAYPAVDTEIISRGKVSLPEKPTQRKIASILSAYDDLIENNNRRIKILEEMAQAIYKEWFVNFRFPGHKKINMVMSKLWMNPEGWEVKTINDFVSIKSGFAFKSGTFDESGIYGIVTIKNVQDGKFISECQNRIQQLPSNLPDYCLLKTGDILFSLTGNIGRVCLVVGEEYLLNQRVAKLVPREDSNWAYTYFTFHQEDMRKKLENISTGVAQKNLSPIETGRQEIVLPPARVLSNFAEISKPILDEILVLFQRNENLRKTRDLLLPKLISGEVDVEKTAIRMKNETV